MKDALRDVKVGDPLLVFDVNSRGAGPREVTVAKIARKFLTTSNGERFEIESGYQDSKDYRTNRWARTPAQVARERVCTEATLLARGITEKLQGFNRSDRFTDEQVTTIKDLLQQVSEMLKS